MLLVGLIIAFAVTGRSEIMMSTEKKEEVYGKEPPTITESFASKEMRTGDTWKVHLKASDPGADMDYILATVLQLKLTDREKSDLVAFMRGL